MISFSHSGKNTRVKIAVVLLLCFSGFRINAQDTTMFEKKNFISKGDTMPYRILLPENYKQAKKKYPLILVLHGSGERGNDNKKQLVHGSSLFLQDSIRSKYPAIVVFPQCGENSFWSNVNIIEDDEGKRSFNFQAAGKPTRAMELLLELLSNLQHDYLPDTSRFYVGGLSMGGMGTFELVKRRPGLFAAAFPICGGGDTTTTSGLAKTSWWIFHGAKDDIVDPSLSKNMAGALQREGADVKLTIYPEANHNSWDAAFAEKDLLPWLFSRHK